MKTINITITETDTEILLKVEDKINSRIKLKSGDRNVQRKEIKLAAFDLVYHYSNAALDSRISLQWINEF